MAAGLARLKSLGTPEAQDTPSSPGSADACICCGLIPERQQQRVKKPMSQVSETKTRKSDAISRLLYVPYRRYGDVSTNGGMPGYRYQYTRRLPDTTVWDSTVTRWRRCCEPGSDRTAVPQRWPHVECQPPSESRIKRQVSARR